MVEMCQRQSEVREMRKPLIIAFAYWVCASPAPALDVYAYTPSKPDKPEKVPPRYVVIINDRTGEEFYYLASPTGRKGFNPTTTAEYRNGEACHPSDAGDSGNLPVASPLQPELPAGGQSQPIQR